MIAQHGVTSEKSTYWWKLTLDQPNAISALLTVNGAVLPRDVVSESEVWFRWDIDFNAGFADLDLRGAEPRLRPFRLTIDPALSKLTRSDFRTMIRDILADSRSLASTSGLKAPLARGKDPLPIATLEFILGSAGQTISLIESLNRSYRRRLGKDRVELSTRKARGLTPAQWNGSRSNWERVSGEVRARMPNGLRHLVEQSGNSMPRHVTEQRSKLDASRREHREILGLLREMSRYLRAAINTQSRLREVDRDEVLISRCSRANRQLREMQLLPLFEGMEADMAAWKHSHLYTSVEPYKSLYRIHRDVRSGISSIDGEFATVPLQRTYQLYETWVALRLAAAARILDPNMDGGALFSDRSDTNKLTFSLSSAAITFRGHTLKFKPQFDQVWRLDSGIGSSSREMVPDMVLLLRSHLPSQPQTMIVLDSKYRVKTQLNAAISSIHTYRDALLEPRPDGDHRAAIGGFVIVPHDEVLSEEASDWSATSMPEVLFRRGYQDRFKLGALTLRPGMSLDAISAILCELVAQFTGYSPASPTIAGADFAWPQKFSMEFRRDIAVVIQKHSNHMAAVANGLGVSEIALAGWLNEVDESEGLRPLEVTEAADPSWIEERPSS
ncbi:nuclease domain-containing protein [Cryobacterium sp. AP23]